MNGEDRRQNFSLPGFVSKYAGFSLHAGIGVEAEQRGKLERLTRYVSRRLAAA